MDDGDDPPGGMPRPEDELGALAKDWIAIWQSEITAYLTDPETRQGWGAMMAIWAGAAQAMTRDLPAATNVAAPKTHERRRKRAEAEPSGTDAAPRPAPAAAAPVARDDEIRRLEHRVAELERHLAEQERRPRPAGDNRRTRSSARPRS